MEQTKDFAAHVAAAERAEAHAQEIKNSRVGGLGGSDAALVLKVGERGLAALTATDHKRLCVMLGLSELNDFGGNVYTTAGHLFEDWVAEMKPWGAAVEYEREKLVEEFLSLQFRTFAHADFYHAGVVVECKFVQDETPKVLDKYNAQLQWYYMLGAREVYLLHGQGVAEPFEVEECCLHKVERDEDIVTRLLAGVNTLTNAIADGWRPNLSEKFVLEDTPALVQKAFAELVRIKGEEETLKARKDEASRTVKEYCEEWQATGIVGIIGEQTCQVIYTKEGVTKTFDVKKLQKAHPELDLTPYYKESKRSGSVSVKL